MATENISTLINNARSRAAVLSSLDNAFEAKLSGAHKRPLNEVELSTHTHNDRDAFIDHLQELLRGTGVYSRQKIEDQIKGKTIVLQHLRSGSTNALAKLKKAHKGHRRASNGDLKKRKQCHVSACDISEEDVAALRGLFKGYMTQFCSGCKNTGQLQARLLICELTGATVSVVESVDLSLRQYIGRKGTVLGESKNCFHIAYEVAATDTVKTPDKRRGKRRRRRESAPATSTTTTSTPDVALVAHVGKLNEEETKKKQENEGNKGEDEKKKKKKKEEEEEEEKGEGSEVMEKKALVVVTAIKEKCRLALSIDVGGNLPSFVGSGKRCGGGGVDGGSSLVCIIHGRHYLPSLETNFNSLPSATS